MATLAEQLKDKQTAIEAAAPEAVKDIITQTIDGLKLTFDPAGTIQPGATLPSFTMPDAFNKPVTSASLLAKGPVLITFYRGDWCPYCNLALRALQKHAPAFEAKGVTLVAISPQMPDMGMSTQEKNELKFAVLSDAGNALAKQLGILWTGAREMNDSWGLDLQKFNGDDSHELPIPTTILVDGEGKVRNIFVEPDFRIRLEPTTALEWVDAL